MNCAPTVVENVETVMTWFESWWIEGGSPEYVVLPSTLWLDCRDWADLHIQIVQAGDAILAVMPQTAVMALQPDPTHDPNDGTTWLDMLASYADITSSGFVTIFALGTGTSIDWATATSTPVGPMGALRLRVHATGSSGTLKAVVVGKKRA